MGTRMGTRSRTCRENLPRACLKLGVRAEARRELLGGRLCRDEEEHRTLRHKVLEPLAQPAPLEPLVLQHLDHLRHVLVGVARAADAHADLCRRIQKNDMNRRINLGHMGETGCVIWGKGVCRRIQKKRTGSERKSRARRSSAGRKVAEKRTVWRSGRIWPRRERTWCGGG